MDKQIAEMDAAMKLMQSEHVMLEKKEKKLLQKSAKARTIKHEKQKKRRLKVARFVNKQAKSFLKAATIKEYSKELKKNGI